MDTAATVAYFSIRSFVERPDSGRVHHLRMNGAKSTTPSMSPTQCVSHIELERVSAVRPARKKAPISSVADIAAESTAATKMPEKSASLCKEAGKERKVRKTFAPPRGGRGPAAES